MLETYPDNFRDVISSVRERNRLWNPEKLAKEETTDDQNYISFALTTYSRDFHNVFFSIESSVEQVQDKEQTQTEKDSWCDSAQWFLTKDGDSPL